MTVVTTIVSIDYSYLRHKSKDRLISLYEQLTGKRLTIDEHRAMKVMHGEDLRRLVWNAWSKLPVEDE